MNEILFLGRNRIWIGVVLLLSSGVIACSNQSDTIIDSDIRKISSLQELADPENVVGPPLAALEARPLAEKHAKLWDRDASLIMARPGRAGIVWEGELHFASWLFVYKADDHSALLAAMVTRDSIVDIGVMEFAASKFKYWVPVDDWSTELWPLIKRYEVDPGASALIAVRMEDKVLPVWLCCTPSKSIRLVNGKFKTVPLKLERKVIDATTGDQVPFSFSAEILGEFDGREPLE